MPRPARSRVAAAPPAAQTQEPETASRRTRASSSRTTNTERREEEDRDGGKRRSRRASAKPNLPPAGVSGDDEATAAGAGEISEEEAEISPVEGGRREPAAARPRRTDVSGLDIEDNMSDVFGNLDSSFDDSHGSPSAAQHHTTTDNTSTTFTIGAFKRRPRQSSIVGRDDAPIRPSSRGLNTPGISSTFTLGAFKRRQREPSILGVREPSVSGSAQKDDQRHPEARATDDESEDIEESFLPEAEGTPIRRSSGRRLVSNPEETSPGASSGRASRKRKSLEDRPSSAKRQAVSADNGLHESIEVDDGPPTPLDNVVRPPGDARASAAAHADATPAIDDEDVMAPPQSSSSSTGSPVWPPLEMLGRKRSRRPASTSRKTPAPGDVSDISSPPSLTYSPNFPSSPAPAAKGRARNTAKPKPPPKTTEELATLLPRRRQKKSKADDAFGLDSSDDEEHERDDEDEPPHAPARRGRSRRPVRPLSGTAAAKQPQAKDSGKAPAASRKPVRRTYGSRNISDKENQGEGESVEAAGHESAAEEEEDPFESEDEGEGEGEDETTQADLGDELKKAAKKFKEVDRWELEFEEIVPSSSPKAAR